MSDVVRDVLGGVVRNFFAYRFFIEIFCVWLDCFSVCGRFYCLDFVLRYFLDCDWFVDFCGYVGCFVE